MDCHSLYMRLFPKVLFGDLSQFDVEEPMPYDVVRSALRNETLAHIIRQSKPSHKDILQFLKEENKYRSNGHRLAKAFAQKFKIPPYFYLKKYGNLPHDVLAQVDEWDTYTGPCWQKQSSLQARIFEDELASVLKQIKKNKPFWREKDIVKKKIAQVTPDFLLHDLTEWWDAKNYYGCPNHFTKSIVQRQAKKYMETWPKSQGFFVFRYGYHPHLQSVVPPNVTLISWYDLLLKS